MADLAKAMHKDPSVVSRSLQLLAESGVLEKVSNRWTITPLGRQVNNWTRTVARSQTKIFEQQQMSRFLKASLPALTHTTALILLGVQNGFADPCWGARNNIHAEENIARLLSVWRSARRPVYHVQHCSSEPGSALRHGTLGADFVPFAMPCEGEVAITKSANSAYIGSSFEDQLRKNGHHSLVLTGFSTNHCIDATTRYAGDRGFSVFVVSDACVSFDRVGVDGNLVKADETHRVVMANLNQEFAVVIETDSLIAIDSTSV